jgi:release factor glutamine methyltransferase
MDIQLLLEKYRSKLDYLDLELIIAHAIKKSREFVLTYPEFAIAKNHELRITNYVNRRIKHEPLAYILREKEFYGLKFKVNKNTLIPRPETELMVDLVIQEVSKNYKLKTINLIDIGTGSGNIIIALAKKIKQEAVSGKQYTFFGTDISAKALTVAKYNAKIHKLYKKIKFIRGNLLEPFIKKLKIINQKSKIIITANLPYGWSAWKNNTSADTIGTKFEPEIALFTSKKGLGLYEKLLLQILELRKNDQDILALFEIDPRQHIIIKKLIKKYFPKAEITFHKDLAGRWRVCETEILNYKF